jgi:PIN like domain
VLATLADRTWLPHRVAEEFHRNRIAVINDNDAAYMPVIDHLQSAQRSLNDELTPKIKYLANRAALPEEEKARLLALAAECTKKAMSAIEKLRKEHGPAELRDTDTILRRFQQLYNGKVGPRFSDDEHEEALQEASRRIEAKIPPGYRDAKKDEPYGDYFLWQQTLTQARTTKPSTLLLVTADSKEDWYQIVKGQTVGARPELAKELTDASGANSSCSTSIIPVPRQGTPQRRRQRRHNPPIRKRNKSRTRTRRANTSHKSPHDDGS